MESTSVTQNELSQEPTTKKQASRPAPAGVPVVSSTVIPNNHITASVVATSTDVVMPSRSLSSLPSTMAAHLTEWTNATLAIINDESLRDLVTAANPPVCTSIWTYGAGFFEETNYPLADYDFHVVLTAPLSYATQVALGDYNLKFHREKGIDVDVYYILDTDAQATTDPRSLVTNWYSDIKMNDYALDDAWSLHRAHVFAGRYATMHGSDPQTFLVRPSWSDNQRSAMALINECIPRAAPATNHGCGTPYGTLQMTRLICTAATKQVVLSKAAAANWALQRDDMVTLRPQIEAAIRSYEKRASPLDMITIRRGIWPLCAYARAHMGAEWQSGWEPWNATVDAGLEWLAENPSPVIVADEPEVKVSSPVLSPSSSTTESVTSPSSSSPPSSTSESLKSPILITLPSPSPVNPVIDAVKSPSSLHTPTSSIVTISPPSSSGPITPDAAPSPVP